MGRPVGIPVKLLHQAEGLIITVELVNGEIYRGMMLEAEDNFNLAMQNVTVTYPNGQIAKMEHVYLRGGQVRFLILPDMLRNAPMFTRIDPKTKRLQQGLGIGRGVRAQQGGGAQYRQ